jgi:hypothetical protein
LFLSILRSLGESDYEIRSPCVVKLYIALHLIDQGIHNLHAQRVCALKVETIWNAHAIVLCGKSNLPIMLLGKACADGAWSNRHFHHRLAARHKGRRPSAR